jgi:hypothetical protein
MQRKLLFTVCRFTNLYTCTGTSQEGEYLTTLLMAPHIYLPFFIGEREMGEGRQF